MVAFKIIMNSEIYKLIPHGYCRCGCGQKTKIVANTDRNAGIKKGEPRRFVLGHWKRGQNWKGESHPCWKGGRATSGNGYVCVHMPSHQRAMQGGYVYEHILVAERVLGKPLPDGAIPHHINKNKADNRPENLVICQDKKYHMLLHTRMRALKACGHANWRKCQICNQYDSVENLRFYQDGQSVHHPDCWRTYHREKKEADHG